MFLNSKPSVKSGASWGTPSSGKLPSSANSVNSLQVLSPHRLHRLGARELKRKPVLHYQLKLMTPSLPPHNDQWGCRPWVSLHMNQTRFLARIYPKVPQRRAQGLLLCPGTEDRILIRPLL